MPPKMKVRISSNANILSDRGPEKYSPSKTMRILKPALQDIINFGNVEKEEEYEPTGNFKEDYINICRQKRFTFVPAVVVRPRRPYQLPFQAEGPEQVKSDRKGKKAGIGRMKAKTSDDTKQRKPIASAQYFPLVDSRLRTKSQHQGFTAGRKDTSQSALSSTAPGHGSLDSLPPGDLPEFVREPAGTVDLDGKGTEDPEAETQETMEKPTTYTTKNRKDYFKPCIQVELEKEDDNRTVTEIYVRGWKVDMAMMEVFQQCWPLLSLLHTAHLWNVGLAADSLRLLASFLPLCHRLNTLVLDATPLTDLDVSLLLGEDCLLQHLSLRFCGITDIEAYGIGSRLVFIGLISLNLSNNQIGDQGAAFIAEGLKLNRTLLTLNLASNRIADQGAATLSTALSRFTLSQKQLVERRHILAKKEEKENIEFEKYPSPRRTSFSNAETGSPSGGRLLAEGLKRQKDQKDQKDRVKVKPSVNAKITAVIRKQSKMQKPTLEVRPRSRKTSTGSASRSKSPTLRQLKKSQKLQDDDSFDKDNWDTNPLAEVGSLHGGELYVVGNRTLLSLNMSRNLIGEVGLKKLLLAVEDQLVPVHEGLQKTGGLQRFVLHRNLVPDSNESLQKINNYMRPRDPCLKSPYVNLEKFNITPCSIPKLL